jgi:hypothetical protein
MALKFGIETIPSPSTTGLIVNINLSNTSSYPGTGTTITDLSGNSNTFTLVGSPTYTAPTISTPGYFSFPGGDITKYIVRNPFNMPTTTVTAAMWIRQSSVFPVGAGCGIFSYEVTGAGNNFLLFDDYGNNNVPPGLVPHTVGNYANRGSNISIANDLWAHVVMTANRTTGVTILYVNNAGSSRQYSDTYAPGTLITAGGSLIIPQEQDGPGAGGLDPNQAFKGDFSSLKIYNRVLSSSEVAVLFNNERTLFGV